MNIISKLKKDPNTDKHEPKRRKISHGSSLFNQNLDVICKRFPQVSRRILKNLDHQSLARSKKVSRAIFEALENERFYWIRIIKTYIRKFEGEKESWNEVILKVPLNIVKPLGLAVIQICKYPSLHNEKSISIIKSASFSCSFCKDEFEKVSEWIRHENIHEKLKHPL